MHVDDNVLNELSYSNVNKYGAGQTSRPDWKGYHFPSLKPAVTWVAYFAEWSTKLSCIFLEIET